MPFKNKKQTKPRTVHSPGDPTLLPSYYTPSKSPLLWSPLALLLFRVRSHTHHQPLCERLPVCSLPIEQVVCFRPVFLSVARPSSAHTLPPQIWSLPFTSFHCVLNLSPSLDSFHPAPDGGGLDLHCRGPQTKNGGSPEFRRIARRSANS